MPMPAELRKLFIRFIELGALLPHEDALDPDDPQAVANSTPVLREMAKVQDEMRSFLR